MICRILGSVGCNLVLDDCRVLGVAHELLDILGSHVPKVAILLIYSDAAVGRYICPLGVSNIALLDALEALCCDVPLEVEYEALALVILGCIVVVLNHYIRGCDVEKNIFILLKLHIADGEVLPVEWVVCVERNLLGKLAHVPQLGALARCGVYDVVGCAIDIRP